MGDDARRTAERRWRETGAADDGRRYLAHLDRAGDLVEALRVRVAIGALHAERLDLAAWLGHAPAREALEAPAAPPDRLYPWAQELFTWGQPACVRAAVAAARRALATWKPPAGAAPEASPLRAIEAAEAWVACPCARHYAEGEAFNRLRPALPDWAWHTVTAAHCAPRSCWHHAQAIQAAAGAVGEEAVRAAIREALVPWALVEDGGAEPLSRPPLPSPRAQA